MTPFEYGVPHEEEEGWLCRSTGQNDTEPFSASGTVCAAADRLDCEWRAPSPGWDSGGQVGSRARRGASALGVQGALTNVGVLQETADPGFSFQLLVI